MKPAMTSDGTCRPLINVRLDSIQYAARRINVYEFSRLDGLPLPAAEAGSHIELHLPNGLVRQYSILVPSAAPRRYAVAVRIEGLSRGGSRYIFDELKVGTTLRISAPINKFRLAHDARHSILVAGGIGVTPLWAMVQDLQAEGLSWELHYVGRSRSDMAFVEPLQRLAPVKLYVRDEIGSAFDLESIVHYAPKHAHLYCCGPARMLKAFEDATKSWPSEQIHLEHFSAHEPANLAGGYTVELARSGRQLQIPPGKSILSVLLEAGIEVDYSCENGVCGSCETTVIAGVPDHRDSVLSKAERDANKTMMICCSGCHGGRLVLDL